MLSLIALVFSLLLAPLFYNYFLLRGIPGPILARFTDFWRLLVIRRGDAQETYLALHKRYGKAVRIGPNCVSITGGEAIPAIYAIQKKLEKSEFYPVQQGVLNGKPYVNLFTTTSNDYHAQIKRPVARAYAMTTLLDYEPFVDSTTQLFMKRLDELYACPASHPVCDFGKWLQYYAFDVIGEMTFSKRFGFLERDADIDGIIQSLRNVQWLFQLAQMPWTDKWFRKNRFQLRATKFTSPVVAFTAARIRERIGWPGPPPTQDEIANQAEMKLRTQGDFLSRFLDARATNSDVVDNTRVLSYAQGNVTAGSDTTAISLRAIFYYLLKNPISMKRLQEELDLAAKESRISLPFVSWTESQKLPYLNAVVKEGFRIHPAAALPLERIVSSSGLDIYGIKFPPGTIVGVNPWVIHRDVDIFGAGSEVWRPERWLEASEEQKKRMEAAMFAFGSGARTCIGKNISLLEIYKLVPALVRRYEFELAEPHKEWKLHNAFFVHQTGLNMRLSQREGKVCEVSC